MKIRGFDVVRLLAGRGASRHDETVCQLAHALQCAALARRHQAEDEVVLAALLHDVGHLISEAEETPQSHHGTWGARFLGPFVPARVAWLVEHHVVAKRYLCTVDRAYAETLSPASLRSWFIQGGPLGPAALREMDRHRWLPDALNIRRWDDLAKDSRSTVPGLDAYRRLLEPCFGPQAWEACGADLMEPSPCPNDAETS